MFNSFIIRGLQNLSMSMRGLSQNLAVSMRGFGETNAKLCSFSSNESFETVLKYEKSIFQNISLLNKLQKGC